MVFFILISLILNIKPRHIIKLVIRHRVEFILPSRIVSVIQILGIGLSVIRGIFLCLEISIQRL